MGRPKPRIPLTPVERLRASYKPSPFSGPHALSKHIVNQPRDTHEALHLLKDNFNFLQPPSQEPNSPHAWQSTAEMLRAQFAALSAPGSLIVPNPRYSKLPTHVLANDKPQPWQLLPLRAAALKHYPDFFGQSTLFFNSFKGAILKRAATQLLRPSKLNLDLAKIMRNLGIISNFEVIQRIGKCGMDDYIWPAGQEPEHHLDLALYPYLYLRLDLRWDAHRPVWLANSTSHSHEPMHTHEPVPSSVHLVSRPSKPVLMTPNDIQHAAAKWPAGILFLYHPSLGIITDAEAQHHRIAALAMAHIGLPWAQVAQIQGVLRAKLEKEAKQPELQAVPLRDWSLVDHVRKTLEERAHKYLSSMPLVQDQRRALEEEAEAERQAVEDLSRRAKQDSKRLSEELVALKLAPKLGESNNLIALSIATPATVISRGGVNASRGGGARGP